MARKPKPIIERPDDYVLREDVTTNRNCPDCGVTMQQHRLLYILLGYCCPKCGQRFGVPYLIACEAKFIKG